jgi:uncharacterized membrane protein
MSCLLPSNPRRVRWLAILILWAGFALRAWNLGAASLWIDEVVTANRAKFPLKDSLGSIMMAGNQVPFYYLLLRGFPTHNEMLLRLPSAFAGTISIALVMLTADRLYRNERLAVLAGALLAFNPLHIWLSRMARSYTLLLALSLLASYAFLEILRGERSRTVWTLFILSSAAAYLTHYFGLILLFAQLAFLLVYRRANWYVISRWAAAQFTAITPFLLWFLPLVLIDLFYPGTLIGKGVSWIPQPHLSDLPLTLGNMAVGFDGSQSWTFLPALFAAAILIATGLIYAFRRTDIYLYWFLLAISLPLAVFVVSTIKPLYVDRYFSIGLPAVLLLMLYGWQRLRYAALRWVLVGIILLTGAGSVLFILRQGADEKTDWRGVAAYIRQTHRPGDGLLFEASHLREPFEYYFGTDNMDALRPMTLSEAGNFGLPAMPKLARLWVVYPNPYIDTHRQGALPDFDPFAPGASRMGDWLIEHRTAIIAQRDFNGIKLFLLSMEDGP